jgi:hypothetical protein
MLVEVRAKYETVQKQDTSMATSVIIHLSAHLCRVKSQEQ